MQFSSFTRLFDSPICFFFFLFFFSNWVLYSGKIKISFFPPQTCRVTHFALEVLERRKIFSNFFYEKSRDWLGLVPRRFLIIFFCFFIYCCVEDSFMEFRTTDIQYLLWQRFKKSDFSYRFFHVIFLLLMTYF